MEAETCRDAVCVKIQYLRELDETIQGLVEPDDLEGDIEESGNIDAKGNMAVIKLWT